MYPDIFKNGDFFSAFQPSVFGHQKRELSKTVPGKEFV